MKPKSHAWTLLAMLFAMLFAMLVAVPYADAASSERAPTLVSTAWLQQHLGDTTVVVLHAAQARADFDAGHVPGSRFVPWAAYAGPHDSLSVELPGEARFDSLLEAAGVRDGDRIVLTGGPVTTVARLLVTLDAYGYGDRASIVNGGIDAWRDEGRPVSRDSVAARPGHVTLRPAAGRMPRGCARTRRRTARVSRSWTRARPSSTKDSPRATCRARAGFRARATCRTRG